MLQFRFPNVPEGFRTFKCASPGCPKMATHMLTMRKTLAHLPNKTRCFCDLHTPGNCAHEGEDGRFNVIEMQAPEGLYLYRKSCDANGYKGWEYAVPYRSEWDER